MKKKSVPRFVVDTDEDFKTQVVIKAAMKGKTYRSVILRFLKGWLKK